MNTFACCFAGHGQLPANKIEKIVTRLNREIENLIAEGITDFISGGAVGFDQIAASLIVAKKQTGKNVRLIFALPCKDQDAKWNEKQRMLYCNLLNEADEIIYVSEQYAPFCMQRRNCYMVNRCSHCICALPHNKSRTSHTITYARKKGLQIIDLEK